MDAALRPVPPQVSADDTGDRTLLGPALVAVVVFEAICFIALRWLYPALGGTGYQVAFGLVQVLFAAALLAVCPPLRRLYRAPGWGWLAGVLLFAGVLAWKVWAYAQRVPDTSDLGVRAGVQAAFMLSVAFVEETLFRGYVWRALAGVLTRGWQVLVASSVVFWLGHAASWIAQGFDVMTAGFQLLWGLVLGGLRLWTKGLVAPLWAHATIDLIG